RSGGTAGLGADPRRDAAPVAAHDPTGRGPADPVAAGGAGQRGGRGGRHGLDAGDPAPRSRGAEPAAPRHPRRGPRRRRPARFHPRAAQRVLQPRRQRRALHPGRRADRRRVHARRRRRRGAVGARQRLRHPGGAPAADHRALLPGLDQPLARIRRHRPGPGDRQAHPAPAPGAAGDRERGRARQHLHLPLRPRTRAPARPPRRARDPGGRAMNPPVPAMPPDDNDPLRDPMLYFNRELSQLDFNFRVLAQARDGSVPLLERLRFLCISCTNLDEFFEIRAATVRHAQDFSVPFAADGIPPAVLLRRIHDRAAELVDAQYRCWSEELRPALWDTGVRVLGRESWNARQTRWLRAYFREEIMPVLSPLGLDPAHPFPKILNKSLNIVVVVEGTDAFGRSGHLAIVRAPRSLPRIIRMPERVSGGEYVFAFLSSVLSAYVRELFPGMAVQDDC